MKRSSKQTPHRLRRALTFLWRVLFTALVIATVGFIFYNSLQNGDLSSSRSGMVTAFLNSILYQLGLPSLTEHVVRKLAHFSEFCLLGFLMTACVRAYTGRWGRYLCWPLLLGLVTANLDETLQLYSADRSSSVIDVWIDFSGVCTGVGIAAVLLLFCAMVVGLARGNRNR